MWLWACFIDIVAVNVLVCRLITDLWMIHRNTVKSVHALTLICQSLALYDHSISPYAFFNARVPLRWPLTGCYQCLIISFPLWQRLSINSTTHNRLFFTFPFLWSFYTGLFTFSGCLAFFAICILSSYPEIVILSEN